jgi:dihydroorotase
MHVHLRDGELLRRTVADCAARFARAMVMPNLDPPVATTAQAAAYRERIIAAVPATETFEPLMTLYLTESTPPAEIERARASGIIHGVKLYPRGATTHAGHGVREVSRVHPTLAAMEREGLPLLVHGEVTDPEVDVFDREAVFIERVLAPLIARFSGLKVVLEHITTREAVEFVRGGPATLAATLTAHHLLLNRNAMFEGGLRPHRYCLPVLKRERDRRALVAAATAGPPKFFLGTDSAPHAVEAKESACGCAGVYTAHAALELYAEVFEAAGALGRLEDFASGYGADFYGLPRNRGSVTLVREPWPVPPVLPFGAQALVPLRAGEHCAWRIATA